MHPISYEGNLQQLATYVNKDVANLIPLSDRARDNHLQSFSRRIIMKFSGVIASKRSDVHTKG